MVESSVTTSEYPHSHPGQHRWSLCFWRDIQRSRLESPTWATTGPGNAKTPVVVYEFGDLSLSKNSNSEVPMVQSAEDWQAKHAVCSERRMESAHPSSTPSADGPHYRSLIAASRWRRCCSPHYTAHIAEHPEERHMPSSTSTVYLTPFTLIRKSIGFPDHCDRRRKEGPRRGRVVSRRALRWALRAHWPRSNGRMTRSSRPTTRD